MGHYALDKKGGRMLLERISEKVAAFRVFLRARRNEPYGSLLFRRRAARWLIRRALDQPAICGRASFDVDR